MSRDINQYYEILGLKPGASPQEVKKAYRCLAKDWHPDRFINNSDLKHKAEAEIKKINQAYEALKSYQSDSLQLKTSQGISTKQTDSENYYSQGTINAESGRLTEALEDFSRAIRINPNYIEAYKYRGFVCSKLGYENRANSDFRKAAELELEINIGVSSSTSTSSEKRRRTNSSSASLSKLWICTRTLIDHSSKVSSVAISPNSRILVSGSGDRTIKLWQPDTEEIFTLKGHTRSINCIAIAPDGKILASGSADTTIRIWDLNQGKILRILGCQFSGHFGEVAAVAISPDGKLLVSGGADETIRIWRLDRGEELYAIEDYCGRILSIAISPDGKLLASGDWEKNIRVWSLSDGKLFRSLKRHSGVSSLSFSPDSKMLAAGGVDATVKLWRLDSGQDKILEGHLDRVQSISFSRSGILATGSWDKTIKLWQPDEKKEICTLTGHTDKVLSLAFSLDDKTLISGSADTTVRIWQHNYD